MKGRDWSPWVERESKPSECFAKSCSPTLQSKLSRSAFLSSLANYCEVFFNRNDSTPHPPDFKLRQSLYTQKKEKERERGKLRNQFQLKRKRVFSQITYIERVPQYMSPRRNWDSPIPSLASEYSPPPGTKGGGGHTRGGWGGSPISDDWRKLSTQCWNF